ncbi:MAG: von Willebrand factor type A domain-containing protein, partial [Gammaproteobacteria bacterium]|nr:von Willebrand factor type A domain-containing protein [Gammaproteobacteria bacterium]
MAACAGPRDDVDVAEPARQPAPIQERSKPAKVRPQPEAGRQEAEVGRREAEVARQEAEVGRQDRARIGGLASTRLEESAALHHWPATPADRERYTHFDDNPVHSAAADPVSTFSIDVDTASYSRLRRFLNLGQIPHADAVRTEELINYFNYGYAPPLDAEQPFAVHLEMGPSPWHTEKRLLKIGLKGFERAPEDLPPANLVFLVDVSGSMRGPDRIDLLKRSLGLLVRKLRPEDRLSIAVYAGAAGVVLEPTAGDEQAKILAALDRLEAGGSTNGGAGIQLAYNLARQAFADEGINRVILATDGDFNVGTVDQRALYR